MLIKRATTITGIYTSADRNYVNNFLLNRSRNVDPPGTLTDDFLTRGVIGYPNPLPFAPTNYRQYNQIQAWFETSGKGGAITYYSQIGRAVAGNTPQPCGLVGGSVQVVALDSEVSPDNWKNRVSSDSKSFSQIASSRLGSAGQKVNYFLNGDLSTTTPWIWSVVTLSSDGTFLGLFGQGGTSDPLSIFPKHTFYRNFVLNQTINPFSGPGAFISLSESYHYAWPQ